MRSEEWTIPEIFRGAVRGLFWTYAAFTGARVLAFLSTLILARILVPESFGQFAIALVVITYLETLGDFGTGAALIYEQKQIGRAANVTFFVSLGTGLLWFAGTFFGASWLAQFFRDPEVEPILRTLAWLFIIKAFGNTQDSLLQHTLRFKQRFVPEIAKSGLKGAAAIVLALMGWGVWSLVWGQIIGATAATFLLWSIVDWRPSRRFDPEQVKKMLNYGSQIVAVNVLAAVVHHVDYLIIGRILGTVALGFYSLANKIPEIVIQMILWTVGKVSFPAYSKMQRDGDKMKAAFLSAQRYISLLTLPAGIGLAVVAHPAVEVLYGEGWEPAIPVLQLLALSASVRSLASHAGDVYKAIGRPDILTKLAIVRSTVLIPTLIYVAPQGIVAISLGLLIVTAGSTVLNLVVVGRMLEVPILSLLNQFKPAGLASAVMTGGLLGAHEVVETSSQIFQLFGGTALGLALYISALFLLERNLVADLANLLSSGLATIKGQEST